MANRFLNNIRINDEYTLPATDGTENQIIVTDGAGNLSFNDLGTVTGAITGVESNLTYYEVKNSSGAQILKGKGVMAVGTDGNSGHILIDEMVADGSVEARYFLGVLSETLDNGSIGRVIAFGELDQFNTTGQNGETWTNGQVLWCDPNSAGDFTITEPDGPNVKIPAAFILKASTNGKIQIRVQANEAIHMLHDTKITTQADGELLVWDNTTGVWMNDGTATVDYTNNRVGINTTSPSETLHVSGDSLVNNYWSPVTTNAYYMSYDSTRGMYLDSSGFITLNAGGNERLRITSTGNIGIGTTNPGSKFQVNVGTDQNLGINSSSSIVRISAYNDAVSASVPLIINGSDLRFTNDGSEAVRITSGNVGIGTTSPSYKLSVNGNIQTDIINGYTYPSNSWLDFDYDQTLASNMVALASIGTIVYLADTNNNASSSNPAHLFTTASGDVDSATNLLNISNNGALQFNSYGSGTFTGTATQRLGVDSSGNVIEIPIGSGAVDGSGAANYVTKWTDADTIGNSIIYDNGTNVGIGTTSPNRKLSVSGAIELTAADATLHTGHAAFRRGSGGEAFIDAPGDITLNIDTNNNQTTAKFSVTKDGSTEIFRVQENANVGIGLTAPTQRLQIYEGSNTAEKTYTTTNAGAIITSYQSDSGSPYTKTTDIVAGSDGTVPSEIRMLTRTSGSASVAERMRITSSGNVGINQTNPQTSLHVVGNANDPVLRLVRGNVTSQYLDIRGYQVLSQGNHLLLTADDGQEIWLGHETSTQRVVMNSSGNVGIGTTSPSYKLDISGGNIRVGSNSPLIDFTDQNNADKSWRINANGADDKLYFQSYNDAFSSGSTRLAIVHSTGNVGIGTASPSEKIEVSGSVNNDDIAVLIENNYDDNLSTSRPAAALRFSTASNNGYLRVYGAPADTAANHQIDLGSTAGSSYLTFSPSGSEKMRITSAGNVGIGTISPSAKLQVSDGTFDGNARVLHSDGTYTEMRGYGIVTNRTNNYYRPTADKTQTLSIGNDSNTWNYITHNANYHTFGTDLNEWMRITNTGNVGIGTTSPGNKLSIVTGSGQDDTIPALGSNGGKFSLLNNGGLYGLLAGVLSNGNSFLQTQRVDSTATAYNMLLNPNGGNVGIGTTSPSEKLAVAGNIALVSNDSFISFNTSGSSGDPKIKMNSDADFSFLNTAGSTNLHIENGGNVGIGTTSPQNIIHSSAPYPTYTDAGVVFRGGTTNNNSHSGISLISSGNALYGLLGSNYIVDGTTVSQTNTGRSSAYVQFVNTTVAGVTSDIIFGGLIKGSTAATERMRIASTGYVGIGTTSPNTTLHIADPSSSSTTFRISAQSSDENYAYIRHTDNTFNTSRLDIGSTYGYGTEVTAMSIFNGNVGIGTTSPAARLDVVGSGNAIQVRRANGYASIKASSDNGGNLILDSDSTGAVYINNYVNRPVYIGTGGGNVGIGTTSASQKLHVVGSARVTGAYYDSGNSAGTSGQVLSSTGTGTDWVNQKTLEVCNLFVEVKASSIGGVAYPYWNGNGYATAATLSSQKIATYSGSLDVVKIACSSSVTGVSMDLYKASSPTVPIWSSGSFNLTANTVYSISPSSAAVTANDLLYLQFNYPGSGAVSYNISLGFIYN